MLKRDVEKNVRSIFQSYGYHEIETPTYEFYDVFEGELKQEELIKFFDAKGRILTLRSDITTPIARIVATKYNHAVLPLRFYYVANAYRGGETFQGTRQHEFTQAGIELIGVNTPEADAEVIALTIHSLRKAGLEDFLIELGQVNFFKGLAAEANLSDDTAEKLRSLIDNKDTLGISELLREAKMPGALKRTFEELPGLYGEISVFEKIDIKTLNQTSREALENIKAVYEILQDFGLEQYITVDLGMVNSLDYYTGIIFKGVTHGMGLPVCGGGRYDKLTEKFGSSMPSTGVAIGINRLMSALYRRKGNPFVPKADALITYEAKGRKNAFLIAQKLREQGMHIEMQVRPMSDEKREQYAKAKHIDGAFHCSNQEDILVFDYLHNTVKNAKRSELLA